MVWVLRITFWRSSAGGLANLPKVKPKSTEIKPRPPPEDWLTSQKWSQSQLKSSLDLNVLNEGPTTKGQPGHIPKRKSAASRTWYLATNSSKSTFQSLALSMCLSTINWFLKSICYRIYGLQHIALAELCGPSRLEFPTIKAIFEAGFAFVRTFMESSQ